MRMIERCLCANATPTALWAGVHCDIFLGGMMGHGDEYKRLNGLTRGGCAVSLGVKLAVSAFDVQLS